ncbi:MAG: hypothetical protein ACI4KR_13220 [Ruminiclostridium sp.]
MTELDKMKRAQMYIQKMAEGINPLTDETVGDNDLVNNVRISRCLYYVSDILKQVIANNGIVGGKSGSGPFFITDEQRALLAPFEQPVFAKDIVERINEITAENRCKKFAARWITEYFVSLGMIEEGYSGKAATESGKEFGIITESRISMRGGEYAVNKYTPDAQRFIFDNLDAIVCFAGSEQYREQTSRNR